MSDDSSKEFAAAQRRHADEARVIRQVSRATGVPASQLRRAAREHRRAEAREARQPLGPPRPISETNLLGPSNTTTSFAPRPFAPPPVPAGGSGAPASEPPLGVETFIVDDNGTLKFFKFNAIYDSDV